MQNLIFSAFAAVGFASQFLVTSGASNGREFTGIFEEPFNIALDGMAQMADPYVEYRAGEVTLRAGDKIKNMKSGKQYAVTRVKPSEDQSYCTAILGAA